MDELIDTLTGLPSYVSQLDLHQHSCDKNLAERLIIRGEEYLEVLEVLCMRCERAQCLAEDNNQTVKDLYTLINIVQLKVAPYIEIVNSNQTTDAHSCVNGSLASMVASVRSGRGRPKIFVSKDQLESLFELGFTYVKVAKMLCISERTLQRRRSELGLPVGRSLLYSQLSDQELDDVVSDVLQV